MKHCIYCNKLLGSWKDYGFHTCSVEKPAIVPFNTSGRTKLQIVINMEETLLKHCLIGPEWAGRL